MDDTLRAGLRRRALEQSHDAPQVEQDLPRVRSMIRKDRSDADLEIPCENFSYPAVRVIQSDESRTLWLRVPIP